MRIFRNRHQAAMELAGLLGHLRDENPIILGLADGGVPLADVIARQLECDLDVLLIERLLAPDSTEHVVGAVDEHGRISMIMSTARWHHLTSQQMVQPAREAFRGIQLRRNSIRSVLPELNVRGRTVVVVCQGIATGAKMLGAVASVRDRGARKVVVAAPAGIEKAMWALRECADAIVIPHRPDKFKSVERFYEEAEEITHDTTIEIIEKWVASRPSAPSEVRTLAMGARSTAGHLVHMELDLPPGAHRGSGPYPAVVFAHGFESDCRSPRNIAISRRLAKRGVIGVRMDFTGHGRSGGSIEDASDEQMLNDIALICRQVTGLDEVDQSRFGLCGSGRGGMIALRLAAEEPLIASLVIRGPVCGREIEAAQKVRAATLLIHAELDINLEESVAAIDRAMHASHELIRVPDSNRMFNDPISHELMVGASVDWLADHLLSRPSALTPTTDETADVELS